MEAEEKWGMELLYMVVSREVKENASEDKTL